MILCGLQTQHVYNKKRKKGLMGVCFKR